MAVDAHNLFLSPPQLFSNRELMMNSNNTTTEPPTSGAFCNTHQTAYGVVLPFPVTDDTTTPLLHMYGGGGGADTTIPTTAGYYAADGTTSANLDCDFFPFPTRKRPRESPTRWNDYHHLLLQNHRSSSSCVNNATSTSTTTTTTTPFSFLGQDIDISSHINHQQHEIDRFVSHHMERVKYEIEEKRKRQGRMIMEAIEQGLAKRLRVKEEERERIGKINHALEERVKSLSIENQIWRDLAQTNEATANHLRNNLEQVLAQVKDTRGEKEEDAQSCCGSSSGEETTEKGRSKCRNCGEEESCVLVLPCRHLCLCGVCGSSVHTCPICRSPKNASVHVNLSA
ncbi:hypothetical protein CARUB_v10020602mg [Capsella rubella]|uniref:RING-type domain-containing protein n=1 Tax=Capsella rubella TaxID=81985 RepID=R0IB77_9BRAS|nr:probable BOI-related E3 ubiquitin-protein ligase 2 [Capsella rubella]EOA35400.1 hypothetical protein CARUB_v10020602mg [Capsella rubella]